MWSKSTLGENNENSVFYIKASYASDMCSGHNATQSQEFMSDEQYETYILHDIDIYV